MVVFEEGFIVEKTTIYLLYDVSVYKEMECCHVVDEGGVIISGNDGNNVGVSGGDNIDVPADNNDTSPDQDEIVSEEKHWHAVDKSFIVSGDDAMESDKNYAALGGSDMPTFIVSGDDAMESDKNYAGLGGSDMPTDKKVIIFIANEDENAGDNTNLDVVDKDFNVSGEADNNVVSVGDKNRFRGLFTKLPSLVRAVLMSRPFWSGLFSILLWITCRHFKKRRSPNLLT
ncbi:TIR-NBS-LRR RCT1 resistance protein, partial [Trifolium medium]|nr:TIR-NBS-LRR RCT1 resistance protein [Trifolium medium]